MAPLFNSWLLATSLLTRLPVGEIKNITDDTWRWCPAFFPLCGCVAAGAALGPVFLLHAPHLLPPLLLAALATALLALFTGGMHLDGFADCCDGFGCHADTEKRFAIMKDPHVGSFGVVGLVVLLLVKTAALAAVFTNGAFAEAFSVIVLARLQMTFLSALGVYPKEKGLGALIVGKAPAGAVALAAATSLIFVFNAQLLAAAAVMFAVMLLLKRRATVLIGGVTGDVLGCCCELCETLGLCVIAANGQALINLFHHLASAKWF